VKKEEEKKEKRKEKKRNYTYKKATDSSARKGRKHRDYL